jgi:DNA-binding CsgD family transcriptional regulator
LSSLRALLRACIFCIAAVMPTLAHAQHSPARQGLLDLRGHDWQLNPVVDLSGEWAFDWNVLYGTNDSLPAPQYFVQVPGSWTGSSPEICDHGYGTYHLTILLDELLDAPLSLQVNEFLTAYELDVAHVFVGGIGKVGATAATGTPGFGRRDFPIPAAQTTVDLLLRGSNFTHRRGGMVVSPKLGVAAVMAQHTRTTTILGGILIGLLLMSTAYQTMRYIHRPQEKAFLMNALWTLVVALHFSCLHDRWMYTLIGEGNWALGYKLELASLFATLIASLFFLRSFFMELRPRWLLWIALTALGAATLFVLTAPVAIAAQIDRTIPLTTIAFLLIWGVFLFGAIRRRADGATEMAIATVAIGLAAASQGFLFTQHVGNLTVVHYCFIGYIFTFSWVLSRRSAAADRNIDRLSKDLEKSNAALAAQNIALEAEVQQRTAELVQVQQVAHDLQMEQVRRDIEALSANNQMKVQLTRNLVAELQVLLQAGVDYPKALKSLIAGLHGQIATEQRLEVLQDNLEDVNAEFYRRLQAKYPQLSKTEREICAYIKLNLSSKDIAQLRNTSINTINVARHRIRKKLEMERDEELEALIANF